MNVHVKKFERFCHGAELFPEDNVFLIDCSGSMSFDDYAPTRLKAGQDAILGFLDVKLSQFPQDRVAIVGFGDTPSLVHSLAEVGESNYELRRGVKCLRPGGGTNLGDALAVATDLLQGEKQTSGGGGNWLRKLVIEETSTPSPSSRVRRIVVLSDGASNSGRDPVKAARKAKSEGIWIDVVGIGPRQGGIEFDEDLLKEIATIDPVTRQPRYVWIGETETLKKTFVAMGSNLKRLRKEVQ